MLKVNTEKIPIDDFGKKYGLIYSGETSCQGKAYRNDFNPLIYFFEKEKSHISYADNYGDDDKFFDLLFDMIKNGDVIKEEGK